MCVPLTIYDCRDCGINHFPSKQELDIHCTGSRHRFRQLMMTREVEYPSTGQSEVIASDVFSKFKHLPLIGHHYCLDCTVTVLTPDATSIDSIASALATHLQSKEHKHLRFQSPAPPMDLCGARMPVGTLPLDHFRIVCLSCVPVAEFTSFMGICQHVRMTHPEVTEYVPPERVVSKRKLPDPSDPSASILSDNGDGMSHTCLLCDVVVWGLDDPHLVGKRHVKAVEKWDPSRFPTNIVIDDAERAPRVTGEYPEWVCELCSVVVYNEVHYVAHLNGKRHRLNVGSPPPSECGGSPSCKVDVH